MTHPMLPLLATALLFMHPAAAAFEHCQAPTPGTERLGPHEDNFIVWNETRDLGWREDREGALRGRLSVKYTICGTHYSRAFNRPKPDQAAAAKGRTTAGNDTLELFFAYTGEFDFYWGERPSDPVINRLNNPGLHLRVPLRRYLGLAGRDDNLVVSVEHRSNGQTTEVSGADETLRANRAYEQRNRAFFDSISRGSNFVGLSVELSDTVRALPVEVATKVFLHFDEDADVTWGPLAGRRRHLSDYERLRVQASVSPAPGMWLDAELRVGDRLGRSTTAVTLGAEYTVWGLPLYLRWHRGPVGTLSNYSQRQDAIGFGLRFARY
ncbi:MAG: hypothetical protein JNJ89_17115 [Rubrivivax sp.]|nr:hypothetical protein [Rubrivivax sp.]